MLATLSTMAVASMIPSAPNAWYKYSELDLAAGTWTDATGNGHDATLRGTGLSTLHTGGHGASGSVSALSGTTSSEVLFGTDHIIRPQFTVCSLQRYTGAANARIVDGVGFNWLFGHWAGLVGVAYFNGWQTPYETESSVDLSAPTNWLAMCGSNEVAGGSLRYLASSGSVSTVLPVSGASVGRGDTALAINAGQHSDGVNTFERSAFAIAELITWPRHLTSSEMDAVLARFSSILHGSPNAWYK